MKNDDEDEGDAVERKEEEMKLLMVIEQGELHRTSNGDGGNVDRERERQGRMMKPRDEDGDDDML